ncbi:MAG: protein translocase subunit SecF [Deltaproteobacteria bacterium]|nr:protein translocase subunit SecF [Deltaproteobacteria bacterium]
MHFQLIKGTNIDFVKSMKYSLLASCIAILLSVASIVWHGGLNLGIDFAGGTLMQVQFHKEVSVNDVRSALKPIGYEHSTIQQFGDKNEFIIRITESTSDIKGLSDKITEALQTSLGADSLEVRRVEIVGPKVGEALVKKALWAIVLAWLGILIYVAFRFQFRFGVGGIIALIHDTIISIGVLSLLNREFDLTVVAAILTMIGYSINDTIIVCDRIRENMTKYEGKPLAEIINRSINETLARTVIVSLTVLLVLLPLFFFGGTVINNFALLLIVGVVVGTYSSIFVASPVVLFWEKFVHKRGK